MRVWGSNPWRLEFLGLRDEMKEQKLRKTAMRSYWQEWPGRKEVEYINFLPRKNSQTTTWNTAPKQPLTSLDEIKVQCKEFFEGISTFPGKQYHTNTDPSIPSKWLPCRPVPVHQQDDFKKQLNDMLHAGVIMEVHEATPWINSFVIVERVKDGKKKLRIHLDPKPLNKAIMHEQYLAHTPDDVYHKLANAKYITVIDFKKSF